MSRCALTIVSKHPAPDLQFLLAVRVIADATGALGVILTQYQLHPDAEHRGKTADFLHGWECNKSTV